MSDVQLEADFDRDGRLTGTPREYDARQRPPGALVVANLDVDRRRLPNRAEVGPEITLDYAQPTKSAGDDELVSIRVRIVNPAATASSQYAIRIPGIQSIRIRIYDERGNILPNPYSQSLDWPITFPSGNVLNLFLEARTLPGSPFGHATRFETQFRPDAEDESHFEVLLLSNDSGGKETIHDRGHFSMVPILFPDNGMRATRLYICDIPDNESSVSDVRTALRTISGIELVTISKDVAQGDTWLQDQFQPGIVIGTNSWRHVIVHLPRLRSNVVQTKTAQNLSQFVKSHFPSRNVGVMNDFWQRQLVFSDITGKRQELQFRDCILLADVMQKVFALLRHFSHLLSRLDRAWQQNVDLTWSEARVMLPTLLAVLRKNILNAKNTASKEWRVTLDSTLKDVEGRFRFIDQALPIGGNGDIFSLPIDNQMIKVDATRSDELFGRINQFRNTSNYGGNIEVAPPTSQAQLGTIVIGNASIRGQSDFIDPDLLRFLSKQRKQPIVQVDTTWLDVGHIDEVLTFVPDRNGSGQTFAALCSSSGLALKLIRTAAAHYLNGLPPTHPQTANHTPSGVLERLTRDGTSPVTRLLRGKVWSHQHPSPTASGDMPDILEPPRIYQVLAQALNGGDPENSSTSGINIHDIRYWPGEGPERAYPADITVLELLYAESDDRGESVNEFIETKFIETVRKQVAEAFKTIRIFPMPVLFDRVTSIRAWSQDQWKFSTSAFTTNVVNMQILNGNLLIPRPYGPRMKITNAIAVIVEVLNNMPSGESLGRQLNLRFFRQHRLNYVTCWIQRQDPVYRSVSTTGAVRSVFNGITTLNDVAKLFKDGFPGLSESEVETRVLQNNRRHFTPDGQLRDGWRLFQINEDTVDLFETFIQLVVDSLGLTLHWIDSWFYHVHFGEIHCGTNVLRVPERGQIPNWWDVPDVITGEAVEMEEETIELPGRRP